MRHRPRPPPSRLFVSRYGTPVHGPRQGFLVGRWSHEVGCTTRSWNVEITRIAHARGGAPCHSARDLRTFVDRLPSDCLLLLDEAYVDFAPPGAIPAIDAADPRVLRLRTFSKAHGMAGARIGYAIGSGTVM